MTLTHPVIVCDMQIPAFAFMRHESLLIEHVFHALAFLRPQERMTQSSRSRQALCGVRPEQSIAQVDSIIDGLDVGFGFGGCRVAEGRSEQVRVELEDECLYRSRRRVDSGHVANDGAV